MLSDQDLQALGASELIGARSNQAHIEYLYEPFFYPHLPTPQYGLGRIGESYISLTAGLVAPTSRGNVSIRSDSISDAPVINLRVRACSHPHSISSSILHLNFFLVLTGCPPQYFETTADQKIAVQSFKNLRKILADPALAPWIIGPDHGEVAPGPSVQSDEDILKYVLEFLSSSRKLMFLAISATLLCQYGMYQERAPCCPRRPVVLSIVVYGYMVFKVCESLMLASCQSFLITMFRYVSLLLVCLMLPF